MNTQMVSIKVVDSMGAPIESLVRRDRLAQMSHAIRATHTFFDGAPHPLRVGDSMSAQDATEAESFVIGQLTHLEAEAIRKWYTPKRYQQILGPCITNEAGAGAKAVDYIVVQSSGIGRRISPGATDVPLVERAYEKHTIGVAPGGIGYSYTQEDLRTAAILKQPLPANQQEDSVEAYLKHMNIVALLGEAASNFTGLYNATGATAAGRASGAVWDSATADVIVADIIDLVSKFNAATQGNEEVTHLIFPLTTYEKLITPRSTNSDTTIKKFIEETLSLTILKDVILDTTANGGQSLGAGSTKRVVAVAPKKSNMVLHIPMPIEFLAPQLDGYSIVVPAMYKYAGYELRRILTVRYMDGV